MVLHLFNKTFERAFAMALVSGRCGVLLCGLFGQAGGMEARALRYRPLARGFPGRDPPFGTAPCGLAVGLDQGPDLGVAPIDDQDAIRFPQRLAVLAGPATVSVRSIG